MNKKPHRTKPKRLYFSVDENVKQVFDYLDEAKRIYLNIAVIMANKTDIDWNDIF